ncbi:MAG: hypothetical protein K9N05_00555 [Candidatus Marinimicrobia bacterium]|nr:hypothetical protein [Candidatus Neomarinimicrobiota bacterium]
MKKLFILLIIISLFYSCSTYVYYPNGLNAPLLKEKGDIQLSLSLLNGGVDIQSAYSPIKNLGLQINANLTNLNDTEVNTDRRSGNYYFEGAAGFYKPLNTNTIFEAYIGTGAGRTFTHSDDAGTYRNTNYFKLYGQVDMGLKWKYINFGLAMREGLVNIYKNDEDNIIDDPKIFEMFFEPAIFMAVGAEKFKAKFQLGYSQSHFSAIFSYPFIIMSAGVEYKFSIGGNK